MNTLLSDGLSLSDELELLLMSELDDSLLEAKGCRIPEPPHC